MKKLMLSLVFGVLLVGMAGFVVAETFSEPGTYEIQKGDDITFNDMTLRILDIMIDDNNVSWNENYGKPIVYIMVLGGGLGVKLSEGESSEVLRNKMAVEKPMKTIINSIDLENGKAEVQFIDNLIGDDDDNETEDNDSFGLGQYVRNRVKAGTYTSPEGVQIRVRELAQNRIEFFNGNYTVKSELNITQEQVQNRTKLKAELSNGRNALIKIMPEIASEQALKRLRLKNCNGTRDCSIELKEVGEDNQTRAVYEARAKKTFKIFGLFRNSEEVLTRIDAETGEEIETRRPWWAWLASEEDEADELGE